RPHTTLTKDIEIDVAIVGAGIAGLSTAFFILKNTDKKVALLERFKMAHGATGHNAGQVVSYFERGFASLVDEFGLELASEGQKAIEDAWELLYEMYTDAGLDIPFTRFLGHAGLSGVDQVLLHLKNNSLRVKGGLNPEQMLISETTDFLNEIPEEYKNLYAIAPQEKILTMLETDVTDFVAVLSYQKGCVNSALFCEGILLYLLKKYPDRFVLYEHTPVNKIILHDSDALIDGGKYTVTAKRVVLCTNGFESLAIFNKNGLDINTKFHHLVHGTVGYMSGYLEKMKKPPIAISYLTNPDDSTDDPYFYLTRREYEYEKEKDLSLISIGGPEAPVEDIKFYSHDNDFPEEMVEKIDEFVRRVHSPEKKIDYIFTWHGLMGYTKNGVRLVGPEPKNSLLMYNLGCNGVGILPSIYGGQRIADFISGKISEKNSADSSRSIFDVPKEYE
ncbi:MAG: FAD-binding oxidoreductase, partial [Patescibacteria group bacterium]